MKSKLVLAGVLAGALTLPVVANAAPATNKVTGGGQVFLSTEGGEKPTGPGDTIAFQAFQYGTPENASGQVNIIDRTVGAGGQGAHYKGTITCAFVAQATEDAPAYAELRGTGSVKGGATTLFQVRIQDDGQAQDIVDLVEFSRDYDDGDDNTTDAQEAEGCSGDGAGDPFSTSLSRGQAKIHKTKSTSKSSQKASWTQTLKLARLL